MLSGPPLLLLCCCTAACGLEMAALHVLAVFATRDRRVQQRLPCGSLPCDCHGMARHDWTWTCQVGEARKRPFCEFLQELGVFVPVLQVEVLARTDFPAVLRSPPGPCPLSPITITKHSMPMPARAKTFLTLGRTYKYLRFGWQHKCVVFRFAMPEIITGRKNMGFVWVLYFPCSIPYLLNVMFGKGARCASLRAVGSE